MLTPADHESHAAMRALRPQHREFVRHYLVDFNATNAYIRAGYSAKGAAQSASKLLTSPKIQAALQALARRNAQHTELTAERVTQEVARLAFSDPRKLFDDEGRLKRPDQWDDDSAATVAAVDMKRKQVRLWSKTDALRLAAQVAKLIGTDDPAPSALTQNNFVVVVPPTATKEEWTRLTNGNGNGQPSTPTHINGNGDHA